MEVALLDTEDFISPVLHNMMVRRRTSAEIKLAVADYFDASSEASEMCRQLLRNIKSTQSNYRSMDNFLASMSDGAASTSASQPVRSNPFCTTTRGNFRRLHDRYSSILQSVKSSHRKVARRLKIVKAIKKRSSKTTASLLRLRDQLDAAAKGSYVLGMDIDTVSQLVARLSDGIERENTLARWCAERAGERCSVQEMRTMCWGYHVMSSIDLQGGMEQEYFNIEEEYNNNLRRQSNAHFLSKEQQSDEGMKVLLETHQDLISPMLQSMVIPRRTSSEIELAMAGYFDASAEASEMCRQLLRDIKSTQTNYQSMDSLLASMSDGTASISARDELVIRSNPFCNMTRSNFRQIHERYSTILQSIRSSHGRVARKLKIVKAVKKLWRTCLVMACGAVAATAIGAAAHLLFLGLLIGPAGLCPKALKKRLAVGTTRKQFSRTTSLMWLREQLDTAAKGTYVLGRDLDTVSQLVARLSDAIERENAMARQCVERAGERCSVQGMVSELRRSCSSSRKLADELEEHVCLCLATIHRARLLVIQDISNQP
ncbi:hypothetical protein BAE44_0011503 [Dichanthelium oligosanthes]|uniref:Uncharacterized protein n=1 Tax=Dichanthelium oligosanthes TaxID=888268 RepID=A0A1E5VQS9_9POAL|nr:hypothetical protein BAE44_0011503 [Dichanthelium oligosanthes]